MICYKGNSFFRIFKILIKDFVEKVKLSFMKRFTNFRRDMSKKNLFFVQIKKFFVQKQILFLRQRYESANSFETELLTLLQTSALKSIPQRINASQSLSLNSAKSDRRTR